MIISYPLKLLHSFSLLNNTNMKRWINMCLFMSLTFILIQIKFNIDKNDDEPLETIWEHYK
jgi:hypothetical protein